MNIFKILASGDGSINEPNVSAFLNYLLNPKAYQGISDELLRKVLHRLYTKNNNSGLKDFLVDKNGNIRNLSAHSNFEIEVLLEQAFKAGDSAKKQIVDIVILCFEKKTERKESLAKAIISDKSKGELKHIFLIENKIKDAATREGQLINQATSTIEMLVADLKKRKAEIKEMVSIIFITPEGEKSSKQFTELEQNATLDVAKVHIHWSADDENEPTMVNYLKEILNDEATGEIEAIDEYTKNTIKSFIALIQNDFKSSIEEELEAETIRDIRYDFDEYKKSYLKDLNGNSWALLQEVDDKLKRTYSNIHIRYSPTHPLSVFIRDANGKKFGKKIFSLTKNSQGLKIYLVLRSLVLAKTGKAELVSYIDSLGYTISRQEEWGYEVKSSNFKLNDVLALFAKQYNTVLKGYA